MSAKKPKTPQVPCPVCGEKMPAWACLCSTCFVALPFALRWRLASIGWREGDGLNARDFNPAAAELIGLAKKKLAELAARNARRAEPALEAARLF